MSDIAKPNIERHYLVKLKLKFLIKNIIGAAILMLLAFCTIGVPDFMRGRIYGRDEQSTKAEVLKVIPLGTSIDIAKSVMEEKGFHCQMQYNQPYGKDNPTGGQKITLQRADFLWCDSGERVASFLVTKRWQVIFLDKENIVSDISVGVGLTGL